MELAPAQIALLAAVGVAVGSFLNVAAYRLPRGESIVRPRSRCPACAVQIAGYDNVPVLSWFVLGGRCRHCSARISPRYPLIEALTGALFVAVALSVDGPGQLAPALVLTAMLVLVAAIDLEHRIVPNRVLAPAAVAAIVLWAVGDPGRLAEHLIAGLFAGAALLIPALAHPRGMGMGDVKLVAVMGLFLGRAIAPAVFVGFALGSIVGVAIVITRGSEARKHAIAFAPYLAAGGIVGQLFGESILDWYLGLV